MPLISPYRGRLVDLLVPPQDHATVRARAARLRSVQLSPRSLCDLELLATGAFSPLDRFMGGADYERVVEEMRLADGTLFPIPVTLPVDDWARIALGEEVALRTPTNDLVALMRLDEVYAWDRPREARRVLGTTDDRHPLLAEMSSWGPRYISGPLTVLSLPRHHDFLDLRHRPAEVRVLLERLGYAKVVAFQTRTPILGAHEQLARLAAEEVGGALLIHPVVGLTRPGDIDHHTRMRAYRRLVDTYHDRRRTVLSLLPLATRMAGPREALWHAIIRRNFGATHFMVGRDHAGPGTDMTGWPVYGPYEAQTLLERFGSEIGVTMVPFEALVHLPRAARDEVAEGVPATILGQVLPPRDCQGFCVWFTGRSGAGKSTIAEILTVLLLEHGRRVTLLDGDVVRTLLSKGLGFSREDRDTNIRRIGFVAAEIVRHHGAAVAAAVSSYAATRNEVRAMVGADRFILVYVDTPLETCEARDTKGMYARARSGELPGFTGLDDPYEAPAAADLVLTTTGCAPEDSARAVLAHLIKCGFVREDADARPASAPPPEA